jgi:hypothetical protein
MTDNDATLIEQLLDGDEWRHMEIRAIAANRLEGPRPDRVSGRTACGNA